MDEAEILAVSVRILRGLACPLPPDELEHAPLAHAFASLPDDDFCVEDFFFRLEHELLQKIRLANLQPQMTLRELARFLATRP